MTSMKVLKFGGACIADISGIQKIETILQDYSTEKLVVVISAIGKTTNALEQIVASILSSDGQTNQLLDQLKQVHLDVAAQIPSEGHISLQDDINVIFASIEKSIETFDTSNADYIYDQIVPAGEMLSTKIVAAFLQNSGVNCQYLDARDVIVTDNNYRDANVVWDETTVLIKDTILPAIEANTIITQGFISRDRQGNTTTLGREGSDYTAAIFGYALDAESVIIWKDVPGILNGDPRFFETTELIEKLSYHEAIEMTYYGAKVIHPKTIKPLQNKKIELLVKSFQDPKAYGTLIGHQLMTENIPPVMVLKKDQVLLSVAPRDFSFITEDSLSFLYGLFAKHRLKINMIQNSAISFSCCIDNSERTEDVIEELEERFKVLRNDHLELLTIRHYDEKRLEELIKGKDVLLEQKSRHTVQMVLKERIT